MGLILLVVLIVLLLGAVPAWPYSRGWGWGPGGLLGLVVVVLLILMAFGHVPAAWAQDTVPVTVVDISPITERLLEAAGVVLMAVAGVLATWLSAKLSSLMGHKTEAARQQTEDMIRQYVERATYAGVDLAMREARRIEDQVDEIEVGNRVVAQAAQYVVDHVPDGLDRLGLTDQTKIRDFVRSRMAALLNQKEGPTVDRLLAR